MTIRVFGTFQGETVHEITLRAADAEARIITWGAVLRDLVVPGRAGLQRVILGLNSIEDYVEHSPYFGAVVGRYANRIAGASLPLGGHTYRLQANEPPNTLHGGFASYGKRLWRLVEHDETSALMLLVSPDGDGGFPGTVQVACRYRLVSPATLRIELDAKTDAPTVVNLANHTYFNLDQSADIRAHELRLAADVYTPVDGALIPTGEIRSVAGTPYDFRERRPIGAAGHAYDTNFALRERPSEPLGLVEAAEVRAPDSGVALSMWTTEPGVQFYDGAMIDCPVPGLGDKRYGAHAGFCLEAQTFPDAPHHRHFPSAELRPEQAYRWITEYRFSRFD